MKKIEKVVAIIPPTRGNSYTGASIPPLGMVRILNYVKKIHSHIETELWDGTLLGQQAIIEKTRRLQGGTLAAISAHTSYNYRNCLEIYKAIPKRVDVVMGGLHLYEDHLGIQAVKKRCFNVIQGAGEFALTQYIEYLEGKRNISEVENLMYLQNGGFKTNPIKSYSQEEFDFPEYDQVLDLDVYGDCYKQTFGEGDLSLVIMSPEGCLWKQRSGGCLFCDIGSCYREHSPEFLPRWIAHHLGRYGHKKRIIFWIYADEATGIGAQWWEKAGENMRKLGLRPGEDFALKIYVESGRGFFESDRIAASLKNCGVGIIHLGAEGGDNPTLAAWKKGCTIEGHIKSAKLAGKYGFKMITSFVLGAPGATKQSIDNIRKLIYILKEYADIIAIPSNIIAPMPGSRMWVIIQERVKEKHPEKYDRLFLTDDPNLSEIQDLWIQEMCSGLVSECGSLPETMKWLCSEAEKISELGSLGLVDRMK